MVLRNCSGKNCFGGGLMRAFWPSSDQRGFAFSRAALQPKNLRVSPTWANVGAEFWHLGLGDLGIGIAWPTATPPKKYFCLHVCCIMRRRSPARLRAGELREPPPRFKTTKTARFNFLLWRVAAQNAQQATCFLWLALVALHRHHQAIFESALMHFLCWVGLVSPLWYSPNALRLSIGPLSEPCNDRERDPPDGHSPKRTPHPRIARDGARGLEVTATIVDVTDACQPTITTGGPWA